MFWKLAVQTESGNSIFFHLSNNYVLLNNFAHYKTLLCIFQWWNKQNDWIKVKFDSNERVELMLEVNTPLLSIPMDGFVCLCLDDTPVATAKRLPGESEEERDSSGHLWRTVIIGDQEQRIDMQVIRPYLRVVTHGGQQDSVTLCSGPNSCRAWKRVWII